MKTLAIRLEDDQHARMSLLAKVSGTTVTDFVREAIDQRLVTLGADAELAAKAEQLLNEHDRQAQAEREALATLLGNASTTAKTPRARKPEQGA